MAHAVYKFKNTTCGNTLSRFWGDEECGENYTVQEGHPYYRMWCRIGDFYNTMGFSNLSDREILDKYKSAQRIGFNFGSRKVEAKDVVEAILAWEKRNWTRYEERRDGRHKVMNKVAFICTLGALGLPDFFSEAA